MSRAWFLVGILLFGFASPAMAQESPDSTAAPNAVADYMMVHVDDRRQPFRYAPDSFEVRPGAVIELMVFGDSKFSMVSVDGAWADAVATSDGELGSVEFRAPLTPGTYRFYDKFTATPTTQPSEGLAGSFVVPEGALPVPGAQAKSPAPGLMIMLALAAFVAMATRSRRGR